LSPVKTAIVIGAGDRGTRYASFARAFPGKLKITGVAEPSAVRRERMVREHGIAPECAFCSWEEILEGPRRADGAIIATQDALHAGPAVRAMERGYRVLLEKPMALTPDDCATIVGASRRTGMPLSVCHVLRYTDFFAAVKRIIDRGLLGDICTIFHAENVSYYHMAHSYVRGNWGRSSTASPMVLAKCCHDMDLMAWFAGSAPLRVASFGALGHFTVSHAPAGAPARCTDGCPAARDCAFEAVDTYLRGTHMKRALAAVDSAPVRALARFMLGFPRLAARTPLLSRYATWKEWPTSTVTEDLSEEGIVKALREGPYGRCVYRCDNDQVDHQETIIEFANGTTAVLRMHGHSAHEGRTLRIDGSLGTLRGVYGGGGRLEILLHRTGKRVRVPVKTDLLGHAEGDYGLMDNFAGVLAGAAGETTASESLVSHLMAFAAHESRITGKIVTMGGANA
jgi:predicted dehydrogenase